MAKSTKLTAAAIQKENSVLNEEKLIRILDKYDVKIQLHFRKSQIRRVMVQYFSVLQELKRNEEVTDETIAASLSLLYALILKEFTDVPIPAIKNIEHLIKVTDMLLDTGIMEEVYDHFPKEQLELIMQEVLKAARNTGTIFGEAVIEQSLQPHANKN
ncbi:hypothetical protein [Paenibacillus sp. y28]|uniref:hypothetical protein n=1 Tax=Paenibacillus sp. y28 TaxID=3129110 RepID=UPI0030163D48